MLQHRAAAGGAQKRFTAWSRLAEKFYPGVSTFRQESADPISYQLRKRGRQPSGKSRRASTSTSYKPQETSGSVHSLLPDSSTAPPTPTVAEAETLDMLRSILRPRLGGKQRFKRHQVNQTSRRRRVTARRPVQRRPVDFSPRVRNDALASVLISIRLGRPSLLRIRSGSGGEGVSNSGVSICGGSSGSDSIGSVEGVSDSGGSTPIGSAEGVSDSGGSISNGSGGLIWGGLIYGGSSAAAGTSRTAAPR
ncbi:hypothetical protein THAOC_16817, partial [Thalassiosira oceanica]